MLVLSLNYNDSTATPSAAEIEQGRRDLAVALGYLQRVGKKAAGEIDSSINTAVIGSIRKNTVQALSRQMDTQEELVL